MKKFGSIYVLTDKTSSTGVIEFEDCKLLGSDHLLKADNIALSQMVVAMFEDLNKFLEKVKMELSAQEETFVRQSLATRAIPSSKLLIKYHKPFNEK